MAEWWTYGRREQVFGDRAKRFEEEQKKKDAGPLDFLVNARQTIETLSQGFSQRAGALTQAKSDAATFAENARQTAGRFAEGFGRGAAAGFGATLNPLGAIGADLPAVGRGLTAFDEHVAKPAKGIGISLAAAPFEATASATNQALGGPGLSDRSTTLSEILFPVLRGEQSGEEGWRKFGQVGSLDYGEMGKTREELPLPLRGTLEAANLAAEVANPAYGPLKATGTGTFGKVERGLMAGADPIGQVLFPQALRGVGYTLRNAPGVPEGLRNLATRAGAPTEMPKLGAGVEEAGDDALPAWAMNRDEFLNRPSGVMVPGLEGIDVPASPAKRKAEEAVQAAVDALADAKLMWAAGQPPSEWRFLKLKKKELRLLERYAQARDKDWALFREERPRVQAELHRAAVEKALRRGDPVPEQVLADYPELRPQTGVPEAIQPEPRALVGDLETPAPAGMGDVFSPRRGVYRDPMDLAPRQAREEAVDALLSPREALKPLADRLLDLAQGGRLDLTDPTLPEQLGASRADLTAALRDLNRRGVPGLEFGVLSTGTRDPALRARAYEIEPNTFVHELRRAEEFLPAGTVDDMVPDEAMREAGEVLAPFQRSVGRTASDLATAPEGGVFGEAVSTPESLLREVRALASGTPTREVVDALRDRVDEAAVSGQLSDSAHRVLTERLSRLEGGLPAGGLGGVPPTEPPRTDLGGGPPEPPDGEVDPALDMIRRAQTEPRTPPISGVGDLVQRTRQASRDLIDEAVQKVLDDTRAVERVRRLPGVDRPAAQRLRESYRLRGGWTGDIIATVDDTQDALVNAAGGRQTYQKIEQQAGALFLYKRFKVYLDKGLPVPGSARDARLADPAFVSAKIAEWTDRFAAEGVGDAVARMERVIRDTGRHWIDQAVETGLLKPEARQAIEEADDFWVHLDVLSKQGDRISGTGRGLEGVGAGVHRLRGTVEDVDDPITSFVKYVGEMKGRVERQKLINETKQVLAPYLERVDGKPTPIQIPEGEAGRIADQVEDQGFATIFRYFEDPPAPRDGYWDIKENGRWVRYALKPEVRVMENLLKSSNAVAQSAVLKAVSAANRPFIVGAVGLNLDFIPTNLARDLLLAYTVTGLQPLSKPWLRGFLTALNANGVPTPKGVEKALDFTPQNLWREFLHSKAGQSTFLQNLDRNPNILRDLADRTDPRSVGQRLVGELAPSLGTGVAGFGTSYATTPEGEDRLEQAAIAGLGAAFAGRLATRALKQRGVRQQAEQWAQAGGRALPPELLRTPKGISDVVWQSFLDVTVRPILKAVNVAEVTTRVGVYDLVRQKQIKAGLPVAEAERRAGLTSRSATADFFAGGEWTRELNVVMPFLKVNVESTRVLFTALKGDPAARARAGLLTLAGLGIVAWNKFGRDGQNGELDKKVPEYVKENDFYIILGDQESEYSTPDNPRTDAWYVRYPGGTLKLFTRTAEHIFDAYTEREQRALGDAVLDIVGGVVKGLSPVKSHTDIVPPFLATPFEVATNYDPFRDRPIEPLETTGTAKTERVTPFTSLTSRKLAPAVARISGNRLVLSPIQMDYLASGVLAGGGRQLLGAADAIQRAMGEEEPPPRDTPNPAAAETTISQLAHGPITRRFIGASSAGETQAKEKVVREAFQPETFDQVTQALRGARESYQELDAEQARLDALLESGRISGPDWRAQRRGLLQQRAQVMNTAQKVLPAIPQDDEAWRRYYATLDKVSPRDAVDLTLDQYRSIQPVEGPDGLPDIGDLKARQEAFLANLPPDLRGRVTEALTARQTPIEREYNHANDLMARYMSLPRYRNLSYEEGEQAAEVIAQARTLARYNGRSIKSNIAALYREGVISEELALRALSVSGNRSATNPQRRAFWNAHPELWVFYGEVPYGEAEQIALAPDLAAESRRLGFTDEPDFGEGQIGRL